MNTMSRQNSKRSLASYLASLPENERIEILGRLSKQDLANFKYQWQIFGRPDQFVPEGDWQNWLILAGRGWGKTRTGAEAIRQLVCGDTPLAPGAYKRIALIAETAADARDVMVEGDSGIMGVHPKAFRPLYEPSKRRLTWPNGAVASLFNATEPDQLRGPQHDCFVAGTLVATPFGDVPIEAVKVGDYVLTRKGPRRVIATRSRTAEVGKLSFSDGRFLVGTGTHPIYTSHGWTAMKYIHRGDHLCAITAWNGVARNGTDMATDAALTTSAQIRASSQSAHSDCIESFGSIITETFQRATTSIMSMATSGTMTFPILNAYQGASIGLNIAQKTQFQGPIGRARKQSPWRAVTAASLNSARSIARWCVDHARAEGQNENARRSASVRSVATCSSQEPVTTALNVASTWQPTGQKTVYCFTVDGQHEYFANGVLVHNCAWADELAKWRYAQETWDMLQFGMRLGDQPRVIITTTPRPLPIIKKLIADPDTVVTRGSTYDNKANLARSFLKSIEDRYEGTRLGRQEITAEVLDDAPGALWSRQILDEKRIKPDQLPDMQRVVVAIDPAAEGTEDGHSETGIICAGLGVDGRGYILDDQSCSLTPLGWARRAIATYDLNQADCIVVETNQGGQMVSHTIRSARDGVPIREVKASRGKVTRAEPIAALYEQGRVSHVGAFPTLEDQLVLFTAYGIEGDGRADRVDALVWALTELFPRIVRRDDEGKWEYAEFNTPGGGAWMG